MDSYRESRRQFKILLHPKHFFHDTRPKISVVGCGRLGGTCLASLIYSNISANITLIEPIEKKYGQERLLYESVAYCPTYNSSLNLSCSTKISSSEDSDICLLCLDYTNEDYSTYRESSFFENVGHFKKIVPQLVHYSPNTVLILLTYPFTLLTQLCYEIAKIPKNRIIGLGTSLATSEFQIILAKKFNISPREVDGYIIGMNFTGQKLPVWSTASVCGVHLNTLIPLLGTEDDPEKLYHDLNLAETQHEALFKQRGPPRWTVGILCARICNAIVSDSKEVFTVTANIRGMYGVEKNCCVGVPCTIGRNGIHSIIVLQLNQKESTELKSIALFSNSLINYLIKRCNDKKIFRLREL